MYFQEELVFLSKILHKCHIQSLLLDPLQPLDDRIDMGLRSLLGTKKEDLRFCDLFPNIEPNSVYRVTGLFLCRYFFLQLPDEEGRILLIGPYLNIEPTRRQILEQGENMGLDPKSVKQLEYFYSSIPVVTEEHHILSMLDTFAETAFGAGRFQSVDIDCDVTDALPVTKEELPSTVKDDPYTIQVMESRYQSENALIEAVSQGNQHKAEQIMAGFTSISFENRVADPLRNIKNYCIVMNTLLRKAAENGGVHPIYLDSISSGFATRIENLNSMAKVPDFMMEVLRAYCRLVRRHSIKHYSPPVQKAIIAIESDLTADLSLHALALLNNVSASYFSGLFKKETGQTLTDYVNGRRIRFAKHLLKTTNLQIQTIAQHCGILDLHYFSKLFKKYTGETPSEYRDNPALN